MSIIPKAWGWLAVVAVITAGGVLGQVTLPATPESDGLTRWLREGGELEEAFAPLVRRARRSVVEVRDEHRRVAYGIVVGKGEILTKASQLGDAIVVSDDRGRDLGATLVAADERYDLALIRVDSADLVPCRLEDEPTWRLGRFLASVGTEAEPLVVGVVSVLPRRIGGAFLGVTLVDADGSGVRVADLSTGAAAERAGIAVGDVVVSFAGVPVEGRDQLVAEIKRRAPGEQVEVVVKRGDEAKTIVVTLGVRESREATRFGRRRRMRAEVSQRRVGFPRVVQHDGVLRANQCGSPIVDSGGRIVGLNIARFGRAQTYALPADVVLSALEELRRPRVTRAEAAGSKKDGSDRE